MGESLQDFRISLDDCDHQLHQLFQQRMEIIQQVAAYKKRHGLPLYDPQREAEILSRYQGSEREFFAALLSLSRYEQSLVLYPYNIVLIGFMGVGKTTVGRALGNILGREFHDLDELLTDRFQLSIKEFFRKYGEEAFRREERLLIEELNKREGIVLATGGGAVLNPENVENLKQGGQLVLLTAPLETLVVRLNKDKTRPLLGQGELAKRIKGLWEQRKSAYEQAADFQVCTDNKTQEEVAREIINLLAANKEGQL